MQRLKRNALFDLEMRGGMNSLHQDSRMEDGIRDEIDLSIRGQVVDNAGQQSTRIRDEVDLSIRGQVVDNAGQRSPRLVPGGNYDEYMAEDQVVDNTRILESKETSLDLNSDETIRLAIRLELRLAEMDKKLQTIMET